LDSTLTEFDPYFTWLGIPLHQRPPTYYQLLGVDPQITDPAVVKALALQRIAYVRNFQKTEHSASVRNCSKSLPSPNPSSPTLSNAPPTTSPSSPLRRRRPSSSPGPSPPKSLTSPPQPSRRPRRVSAGPVTVARTPKPSNGSAAAPPSWY
jgi:hypothetical protein